MMIAIAPLRSTRPPYVTDGASDPSFYGGRLYQLMEEGGFEPLIRYQITVEDQFTDENQKTVFSDMV